MTYRLLTVEPLGAKAVVEALAQCLNVSVQDMDVGDDNTDQEVRNWDALVLCEKAERYGDVSTSLDIYVQDSYQPQPEEADVAASFARAANAVVLYPAEEAPPSAYWLAAPDGTVARARLDPSDDEMPVYSISAVESPVAQLPRTPVTRFEEIVREQKVATPFTDRFRALMRTMHPDQVNTPGTAHWHARSCLGAWEKFTSQMSAGWTPSGWYPPGLYRERLEARNELDEILPQLPVNASELLKTTLALLDERFTELTVEDGGSFQEQLPRPAYDHTRRGWWWKRRPDPVPWDGDSDSDSDSDGR